MTTTVQRCKAAKCKQLRRRDGKHYCGDEQTPLENKLFYCPLHKMKGVV